MGDIVVEKPGLALGPVDPIVMGCATVMIGVLGMGSPQAAALVAAAANGTPFCEECEKAREAATAGSH